ncbi:LmeA family phospholipid-binding protein [bacterium]|nr:LmeA family phospholipid-binding protein [bacterium]
MPNRQNEKVIRIPDVFSGEKLLSSGSLIAALVLSLVLANFVWLFFDKQPQAWDESIHFMGAVGYYKTLLQGGWDVWYNLLYQSDFYPPLIEVLTGLVFLVTKPVPDVAAFLNLFYLLGIVWVLVLIGRTLYDETTGILAGYLFSAAVMVAIQSKYFMLDIPMVLQYCLGFYFYLQSENFRKKRWSLLYGMMFGLAMLNKWSALFFFAPPPLILGVISLFRQEGEGKKIWRNILLAFGLAGLMAAPWYSVHFIKLVKNTSGYIHARGVLENDPPLTSPLAWIYYLGSVFRQMSWPLGLTVVGGFVVAMFKKRHRLLLAVWLGSPYIILMLIRNKDHRYTLPLLPIICLVGISWIAALKPETKKKWVPIIALAALAQFAYVHMGQHLGGFERLLSARLLGTSLIESKAPDSRIWPLDAILADVAHVGGNLGRPPQLRVIPDAAKFSRVTFVVAQSRQPRGVQLASTTDWPAFTDFVVTKTKHLGLEFNIAKPKAITEALANSTTAVGKRFELMRTYPLPDGSDALLYRRREVFHHLSQERIILLLKHELDQLLSAYLRNCEDLSIRITSGPDQSTRIGHFPEILVEARNGEVGDFKHKPLGVPFSRLKLALKDLVIDLDWLEQGKPVPYYIDAMRVMHVQLKDEGLNRAFQKANDDLKNLRVFFTGSTMAAHWIGDIPLSVNLALEVVPDKDRPESDNLRFRIEKIKCLGIPIAGFLIQPLVADFNPLFKLAGFPGKIVLGQLRLEKGILRMGIEKKEQWQRDVVEIKKMQ